MSKTKVNFSSTDEELSKKISSDPQLNALKKMRNIETDREWKQDIQKLIDNRLAEIIRAHRES